MIIKKDKNKERVIRHKRIRKKISGTAQMPRLNVYRSLNEIYAQIINDEQGTTLVSSSTKLLAKNIQNLTKTEQARAVGKDIAEKALKLKIENVVFDRGGYLYIGRVQALADGAREAGLKF